MSDLPGHQADPTAPIPDAHRTAGLGVRAVARLIDFVLLGVVNVVVGVVLLGALLGQSGAMPLGAGASGVLAGSIGALLGAVINLSYFAVLESRDGQTLGKRVASLRTVDASGGVPSLEQAVRRNVWVGFGVAGVVPLVGGAIGGLAQLAAVVTIALTIAADGSDGRGWHDRFAGATAVVPADQGARR
jgi:uncharacterized RDD family membrane protein YckC